MWHELLPPHLRSPDYRFDKEYAWPRNLAPEAIALLEQRGQRIIGVDTWLPTRPYPTMVVYDWDAEKHLTLSAFASTASGFVRSFHLALAGVQDQTLPPYFNLTVA